MKFFVSKKDLEKLQSGYAGPIQASSYRSPDMVEVSVPDGLTPETILKCKKTWLESIKAMGSSRVSCAPSEEQMIARAIQIHGAEWVELALFGARFEPATESFNPREYIDITRILLNDKQGKPRIQKFIEFGVKGQEALRREEVKAERVAPVRGRYVEPSPEVRAMLRASGFGSILPSLPPLPDDLPKTECRGCGREAIAAMECENCGVMV